MAHSHHHHPAPALDVDRATRWVLVGAAVVLALATLAGVLVLRPGDTQVGNLGELGVPNQVFDAEVVEVVESPCPNTQPGDEIGCITAELELLQGPDEGETILLDFPAVASSPDLEAGDEVVLGYTPEAEPRFQYFFVDRQRKSSLLWLTVVFAVAVVALGRLRGAAALVGLGASLVVLLEFVLPAVLDGESPLWVALVGAAAIAYLALYLAHGATLMTTVALLGTLASLAVTAALATAFMGLAEISGFASEEALILQIAAAQIDLEGLILGGVVIGALGAIDDVTVTQASAMWELRAADPTAPLRRLWAAGIRIGRDHVASTVNTLVLAYAGASLPLFILFVLSEQSLGTIANSEVVATEIVRGLVGSIGLVTAVPITTALAGAVLGRATAPPAGPAPAPAPAGE